MEEFNTVQLLDRKHYIGACVIYPNNQPSKVCVEMAMLPNRVIGRVTYEKPLHITEEEAKQFALQKFLADKWDIRLLAEPGDYDGGVLVVADK